MSDNNVTCGSSDSANDGCDNYEEGESISDSSTQLEGSFPELTNKLHFDELVALFSWLSIWDLATVKRVCHSWREAAQNNSLWKNHVLVIKNGDCKDEINVKLMPHIKNIRGRLRVKNSFLNVILENVTELSDLNVEFTPPISSSQVSLVLEKYPELESIKLGYYERDILEILEKLKRSQHLKKINSLLIHDTTLKKYASPITIFKVFADCNNFPALTDLNISDAEFSSAFFDSAFRNLVVGIITKRSQQLLSLKLDTNEADCSSILNTVKYCVKLQRLDLEIKPKNNRIEFQNLNELKSLYLYCQKSDESFNTSIQNSLEKGTWTHLTEMEISLHNKRGKYNVPALKSVIDTAKHLRRLLYTDGAQLISEQHLESISSLIKLEKLILEGFEKISPLGIGYLSECYSLKELELESRCSDIFNDDPCIVKMFLQLTDLKFVSIKSDEVYAYNGFDSSVEFDRLQLYLMNRKEIERHVSEILSES